MKVLVYILDATVARGVVAGPKFQSENQ